MVKNKKAILSLLFFAWAIIFVHSVVPHHHHIEGVKFKKTHHEHNHLHDHGHSHSHQHDVGHSIKGIHKCNDDCHEHTCHFHVDVFAKISIDQAFIAKLENSFFSYIPIEKSDNITYLSEIVFEQLPKTDHLRGPPFLA